MTARLPTPPAVELHIDEVTLDGFSAADGRAIAAAMERELARLLSGPDAPLGGARRSLSLERLDAGALHLPAGAKPGQIGVAAARAISRSLGAVARGGAPNAKGPGR
jgi:hypothetical protein